MRTDKEQLDVIIKRKAIREAAVKKRNRTITSLFCLVLVLSVVTIGLIPDNRGENEAKDVYEDSKNVYGGDADVALDAEDEYDITVDMETPDGNHGLAAPDTNYVDDEALEDSLIRLPEQESSVSSSCEASHFEADDYYEIDTELYGNIYVLRNDNNYEKHRAKLEDYRESSDLFCHDKIGLALSWMLYIKQESGIYHTIVCLPGATGIMSFEEALADHTELNFRTSEWLMLENDTFYFAFSAKELYALAEAGVYCYFVGSGTVDQDSISVNDKEGIEAFCEYYGDHYSAECFEQGAALKEYVF